MLRILWFHQKHSRKYSTHKKIQRMCVCSLFWNWVGHERHSQSIQLEHSITEIFETFLLRVSGFHIPHAAAYSEKNPTWTHKHIVNMAYWIELFSMSCLLFDIPVTNVIFTLHSFLYAIWQYTCAMYRRQSMINL